jgi:hypothetical protein
MNNNNGTLTYIPDGYTQTVYFAEFDGVYGEFRATFRPMSVALASKMQKDLQQVGDDAEKRNLVVARWMAHQTVSWDVESNGQPVNHKDVNEIMHLPVSLFNRYANVLSNIEGGDPDPAATDYDKRKKAATEQAVAMSGLSEVEALEKNSL